MKDNGILVKKYQNSLYKEFFRKLIHLCSAFIPLLLSKFYYLTIILLALAGLGYTISEIVRIKGHKIPIITDVTLMAARGRDNGKFVLGPICLVVGIIITALVFPGMPSTIGILSLAFGDGLASLFGKMFGKTQIPFTKGKTFVGSFTCFVAIFCCTYAVCKNVKYALIIAVSGTLIEIIPLKDFDNLIIPFVLALISYYLIPIN